MFLPNIERIEIAELGMHSFEVPTSAGSSRLKSLTIGLPTSDDPFGYSGFLALSLVLERFLVRSSALQHLDVTFTSDPNEGDDNWDTISDVLNNHARSLRSLHLRNPYEVVKPAVDGGPINLAAMTNLRTLTLPGDAILPTRYVPHRVSTTAAEFSTFNLEPRLTDTSRDDERVPLTDTLPPNLTQLDVVDHRTDPSKIARLDSELRELMSSPRFEDLEIIRFWRVREPKNLVVSIDRKAQREQGCWEVSRRI